MVGNILKLYIGSTKVRNKIELYITGNAVEYSIKAIHGFIRKVPVITFIWRDHRITVLNYNKDDVLWGVDEHEYVYKMMDKKIEVNWEYVKRWIPKELKLEIEQKDRTIG